MKLLILGNGFDLHHGLQTSFSNFRKYLLDSSNDLDNVLCENIDRMLSKQNLTSDVNLLWTEYERAIGLLFSKNINVTIEGLNAYNLSEQFVEKFYEYLIRENKTKIKTLNPKIKEIFKDADCILTFNYTDTYKHYIPTDKQIEVFHIHGKLNQQDLPIIGYFYPKIMRSSSIDYLERYRGYGFHKPALALKQNEIEFENRLAKFEKSWRNKFSEIISIGYSYGDSDSHVYSILNSIALSQLNIQRVPKSQVDKIPTINYKVFKYNDEEYVQTIDKIKREFLDKHKRNPTVDITGGGIFTADKKDIIIFEPLEY